MRKLASVQKIANIEPIEKADRIELITVLGWQCVGKKGEFEVGDLCVYFEIDSILPDMLLFDFMRPRKFKVKTARFRKQISQGLVMPISILKTFDFDLNIKEGLDVTDLIGVKKYDPEKIIEFKSTKKQNQCTKYFMKYKSFRRLYSFIFPRTKGEFPDFIKKTDEERIQNNPNISTKHDGEQFYFSEKLDGQSCSIFYNSNLDRWFRPWQNNSFGVCSRNIWKKHPDNSNWWKIVKQKNIQKKLTKYCKKNNINLAVQGEIIGPGIQKNRYQLKELDFYIFNVFNIDSQKYFTVNEKNMLCVDLDLKVVPFYDSFVMDKNIHNVKWFIDHSDRKSVLYDTLQEGFVCRKVNDENISFKIINPKYLL